MAGNQSSSTYSSHPNVMQRKRKRIPGIPPGFYFNPTDEDLIKNYVWPYNNKLPLPNDITIPKADVYTKHPTTLPCNFQYGIGNEFYCFTQWKPKDDGGSRIDRQVGNFSWKTNDEDSKIPRGGFKKTFSFHEGKSGGKGTGWIIHEYSLHSSSRKNGKLKFNHYVLCKIKPPSSHNFIEEETTTTSNSNEVIRRNEDIFEDLNMTLEDQRRYSPLQWTVDDIFRDFIQF